MYVFLMLEIHIKFCIVFGYTGGGLTSLVRERGTSTGRLSKVQGGVVSLGNRNKKTN